MKDGLWCAGRLATHFTVSFPAYTTSMSDKIDDKSLSVKLAIESKNEKVPRGIRGEKSSKDMASSRNLVSTIGAQASPTMGDGTRCPEG